MSSDGLFVPLDELTVPGGLPIGELLDDVLNHIWVTAPTCDFANDAASFDVFVDQPITVKIPGADWLELAVGSMAGGVNATLRIGFTPPGISIELPLTLRLSAEYLKPMKAGSNTSVSAEICARYGTKSLVSSGTAMLLRILPPAFSMKWRDS